jgi:hypothetical protein
MELRSSKIRRGERPCTIPTEDADEIVKIAEAAV